MDLFEVLDMFVLFQQSFDFLFVLIDDLFLLLECLCLFLENLLIFLLAGLEYLGLAVCILLLVL